MDMQHVCHYCSFVFTLFRWLFDPSIFPRGYYSLFSRGRLNQTLGILFSREEYVKLFMSNFVTLRIPWIKPKSSLSVAG